MQSWRGMAQQRSKQSVNVRCAEQVQVVQHQDEVAFEFGQLVDQAVGNDGNRGRLVPASNDCVWRSEPGNRASSAART